MNKFKDGGQSGLNVTNMTVHITKAATKSSTDMALAVRNSFAKAPTEVEYNNRAIMYMLGRELSRAAQGGSQLTEMCEIFPITGTQH